MKRLLTTANIWVLIRTRLDLKAFVLLRWILSDISHRMETENWHPIVAILLESNLDQEYHLL